MSLFSEVPNLFTDSRKELRKTSTLTISAVLIGLSVVMSFFTFIPNQYMKIGFSSLPVAVIGMLFGPLVSGLAAGIVDILAYLLKPTGPYFPGFTFDKILMGVFFGLFLYHRKPSLKNVIIVRLLVTGIVNLGFNTLWLCVLYGQALVVIFPARVVKNLAVFPIEVLLLYVIVQFIWRTLGSRMHLDGGQYLQVHRNTDRYRY